MDEFKDVTVVKKANVYFDGKVTSRTIRFENGSKKTLGFMLPGEYVFSTDAPEAIEVLSGTCGVLLSGSKEWKKVKAGGSFDVPGSSKFKIKILEAVDYCCSFL
jgi:uncharacterized protein YaiE (UPF0345 family)